MDLRPELMPPVLNKKKVKRLAKIAARLDGAYSPGLDPAFWEEDVATFNRIAGTTMTIEGFQGIYGACEHDEQVRSLLFERELSPTLDLTREEMAEIVARACTVDADQEFYLQLFCVNCKHPGGSDLIFYPNLVTELPQDREATNEEIADVALGWEPRIVAMRITKRSGGNHVEYFVSKLEAPGTPETQIITPLDTKYEVGVVGAVALKGMRLEDGSVVETSFEFRGYSCGKILGLTDQAGGDSHQQIASGVGVPHGKPALQGTLRHGGGELFFNVRCKNCARGPPRNVRICSIFVQKRKKTRVFRERQMRNPIAHLLPQVDTHGSSKR